MKRVLDEVIDYVCRNGLFSDSGLKGLEYNVRYNGKFYCASDTHELVLKIMRDAHPQASTKGY